MQKDDLNNKILLNSGRNCLRYIVRAYNISEINIPYYICPVVWQSLKQEGVKINFYHIDDKFMPTEEFKKDDYVLYPNYFGLCSYQSKFLANKYKNLILDNAHAFFAEKKGLAAFYSPRKFFHVNDGGILDCEKILNGYLQQDKDRTVKIVDFDTFCQNELSIDNQPIKIISKKTLKTLSQNNFEKEREKRIKLFWEMHSLLKGINEFEINIANDDVPMIFPLICKKNKEIANILNQNGIYTLKYWTNLPKNFKESIFQNEMLAIPLTQNSLKVIKLNS